ncbi:MAG: hypothetical protein R3Y50_06090 [Rikenellaceae bacterium]
MNVILNFKEIIRQYVAPHRRQVNRLGWLYSLIDLTSIWDKFAIWRVYYRYKVHVTSQHQSLQGHLNKTFGGGIIVKSYDDQFLEIGLNSEEAHWVMFNPYQEVALVGESGVSFIDVDFIVYAPSSVDINLLSVEIERYKLADKAYKIITS